MGDAAVDTRIYMVTGMSLTEDKAVHVLLVNPKDPKDTCGWHLPPKEADKLRLGDVVKFTVSLVPVSAERPEA